MSFCGHVFLPFIKPFDSFLSNYSCLTWLSSLPVYPKGGSLPIEIMLRFYLPLLNADTEWPDSQKILIKDRLTSPIPGHARVVTFLTFASTILPQKGLIYRPETSKQRRISVNIPFETSLKEESYTHKKDAQVMSTHEQNGYFQIDFLTQLVKRLFQLET